MRSRLLHQTRPVHQPASTWNMESSGPQDRYTLFPVELAARLAAHANPDAGPASAATQAIDGPLSIRCTDLG